MDNENINPVSIPARSRLAANASPSMRVQNGRQRQVDELYDLFDTVMIESLLKRHPSLNKFSGA